jgi:hypothetical protein
MNNRFPSLSRYSIWVETNGTNVTNHNYELAILCASETLLE